MKHEERLKQKRIEEALDEIMGIDKLYERDRWEMEKIANLLAAVLDNMPGVDCDRKVRFQNWIFYTREYMKRLDRIERDNQVS